MGNNWSDAISISNLAIAAWPSGERGRPIHRLFKQRLKIRFLEI